MVKRFQKICIFWISLNIICIFVVVFYTKNICIFDWHILHLASHHPLLKNCFEKYQFEELSETTKGVILKEMIALVQVKAKYVN